MSRRLGFALALVLGCGGSEPQPDDPLDRERVLDVAARIGSATGEGFSGRWRFTFSAASCDCPTLEVDGEPLELCELAALSSELELELVQSDGLLGFSLGPMGELGALTGAVEDDGSFDLAGTHDASTALGSVELLRRATGSSTGGDTSEAEATAGWAGQRLVGELGDTNLDCRWVADFEAERI